MNCFIETWKLLPFGSLAISYTMTSRIQIGACSMKQKVRISRNIFSKTSITIFCITLIIISAWHYFLRKQLNILSNYNNDNYVASKEGSAKSISTFTDDPKILIDLNDFKYIINQPVCDENVKALIMIHSAPLNIVKRTAIRETWGNSKLLKESPLRILFAFGDVTDGNLTKALHNENTKYQDCVQGSFIDDYRNLTYKQAMILKWHATYCDTADILIKVDDDVFLNTPQLIEYANKHSKSSITPRNFHETFNASDVLFTNPKNLICCNIFDYSPAIREKDSKWYVSEYEYPHKYYPRYCEGLYAIYSTDVVKRLLQATMNEKYFWIDDVFITGLMAKKINAAHTDMRDYFLDRDNYDNLIAEHGDLTDIEFIVAWYDIEPNDTKELWKMYIQQLSKPLLYSYLKMKIQKLNKKQVNRFF